MPWSGSLPEDDRKQIDLDPLQWRVDKPHKREPFFGEGAPEWVAYVIGLVIVLTVLSYLRG
jgi:hypothetical protein